MIARIYNQVIQEHFEAHRQMLFFMGPRQVGKTTTAVGAAQERGPASYLSWDNDDHRERILAGPAAIAKTLGLESLGPAPPILVLDEVHKYGRWKTFLKGLFDTYSGSLRILVTGSARLDVFKAGGDSLMGRYFPYRMHPLSVAEIASPRAPGGHLTTSPRALPEGVFEDLLRFGGFPEPFAKGDVRFWRRWRRLRSQLLFKEDLRDLTRIQELGQVEMLAELVRRRVGQLVSYSSLAREVRVSVDSVRRWIGTLESLYFCFKVRPWHRNVSRALRKEPKYFLWDWSQVDEPAARAENLVASALLKAVHFWTDHGWGDFGLFFVRDKEKREVDFLVVRDGEPWFLAEVKLSGASTLSPHLRHFQVQTGARHAFQVTFDSPFVRRDCFEEERPVRVPARTLLSQLV